MPRLTKRFIDFARVRRLIKDATYWDDRLTGFGLRVQPGGAASYVIMYRTQEGRLRKLTLGSAGTMTPDEARSEARQKLADVDKGGDPPATGSGATRVDHRRLCDWYLKEASLWIKPGTLLMDGAGSIAM
jgi:hypothetical protein